MLERWTICHLQQILDLKNSPWHEAKAQSINQMFISSNHPLRCSKDKRPFAGPPTTWKAQIGEQVDHIGASQYTVWWNMLIAGSVEKVKRQWLQLKPDQASWAQNSDMELVSRWWCCTRTRELVLSSLVLLWKNVEAALENWASEGTQFKGCRCRSQFLDVEVDSLVVKRRWKVWWSWREWTVKRDQAIFAGKGHITGV